MILDPWDMHKATYHPELGVIRERIVDIHIEGGSEEELKHLIERSMRIMKACKN